MVFEEGVNYSYWPQWNTASQFSLGGFHGVNYSWKKITETVISYSLLVNGERMGHG